MPCPYAERRGTLVICRVRGTPVNPLAYPCLGEKYHACPIYREAQSKKGGEAGRVKAEAVVERVGAEARRPAEAAGRTSGAYTLGLTSAGGRPASCDECVFYSKRRSWCFLLGVKVSDPSKPPCSRA